MLGWLSGRRHEVLTAVALTGGVAYWLQDVYHWPVHQLLAPAALERLTLLVNHVVADEAVARVAIPAIRGLLTRLTAAEDSAWAYIRIAEAHILMDEVKPACTSLRTARGLAQSMAQARVINNYTTQMSCGQP